jgi:hypothetical protein
LREGFDPNAIQMECWQSHLLSRSSLYSARPSYPVSPSPRRSFPAPRHCALLATRSSSSFSVGSFSNSSSVSSSSQAYSPKPVSPSTAAPVNALAERTMEGSGSFLSRSNAASLWVAMFCQVTPVSFLQREDRERGRKTRNVMTVRRTSERGGSGSSFVTDALVQHWK